jgi:hypothetical protein
LRGSISRLTIFMIRDVRSREAARDREMFAFELDARLERPGARQKLGARVLQLLARRKRPARVPHDHREMEQFWIELEMRKAQAQILGRFRVS